MSLYYKSPQAPLIPGDSYVSDIVVTDNSQIYNSEYISSTIDSFSATTGSLIIAGGLGLSKSLFVNGTITAGAISSSSFIEPVTFNGETTFNAPIISSSEIITDFLGSNVIDSYNQYNLLSSNMTIHSSGTISEISTINTTTTTPFFLNTNNMSINGTTLTINTNTTFHNETTFMGPLNIPPAGETQGTATLVGGTVVVNTAVVSSSSCIYLTIQNTNGGTVGTVYISNIVPNANFTITSTSSSDVSTVAWLIIQTS